jgi:hypothetical protein
VSGLGGIRALVMNRLADAWLFYKKMSVFRKSHGIIERPEWGESLRERHKCECPVLPIVLHKADLLFTPRNGPSYLFLQHQFCHCV